MKRTYNTPAMETFNISVDTRLLNGSPTYYDSQTGMGSTLDENGGELGD